MAGEGNQKNLRVYRFCKVNKKLPAHLADMPRNEQAVSKTVMFGVPAPAIWPLPLLQTGCLQIFQGQ